METKTKFSLWYVVIAVWAILIIQNYIASQFAPRVLPYSAFIKALKDNQIIEVVITEGRIAGKMKVTENDQSKEVNFTTYRVDIDLSEELAKHNVIFRGQPENTFLRDLFVVGPACSHFLRPLVSSHEAVQSRCRDDVLREEQGQGLCGKRH